MSNTKEQVGGGTNTAGVSVSSAKGADATLAAPASVANPKEDLQTTTSGNSPSKESSPEPKVAFRAGAIGKEVRTAKSKDYFAEQNEKSKEEKQVQAAKTKRLLMIAGLIVGVVLVVGLVVGLIWLIIAKSGGSGDRPYNELTEEGYTRGQLLSQEVYDAAVNSQEELPGDASEEERAAAADQVYQEAISSAENDTEVNIIRISQMRYWLMNEEYSKITETDGNKVCGDEGLGVEMKIACSNIMALAFYYEGNESEYNHYLEMTDRIMDEGKSELETMEGMGSE